MTLRNVIAIGTLALVSIGYGQVQHQHWYFGFGAGLDFSSGSPVATGGPLSTDEGCASISDVNGDLLFFTNGERVWDRNLNVMPNGNELFGHFSSSQSALIVPIPGQTDQFELFTAPAGAGFWTPSDAGHHHRIDMTANGGLGDVITANQPLAAPLVEMLTATRHANGEDVWVLYHGWNNADFYAYLLTCDGIEGPVVSSLGHIPGLDDNGNVEGMSSCMKLDRQGQRLASVWTRTTLSTASEYRSHMLVQLFDFDNNTGQLSNLRSDTIGSGNDLQKGYGVEFSPSGELLYVNDHGLFNGGFSARVWQYDLSIPLNDPLEIASGFRAFGTMQLGPDGVLYIARLNGATYLSTIPAPDVVGTGCGFVDQGVSLGTDISTWGLPNDWDAYPEPTPIDPIAWTDSLICGPSDVLIAANYAHPFHVPEYLWSTGETTSSITVNDPGTYTVELLLPCTTIFDTVRIRRGGIPFELGEDVRICDDDKLVLEVPEAASILWSTGDTISAITVEAAGHYRVQLTDTEGCTTRDSLLVSTRNCACSLYLPNAFTPNNDGINDCFLPVMDCDPERFELELFDRWGALLFRSTDPLGSWDGNEVPTGVYTFRLRYAWDDGDHIQARTRNGHVTLLR